MHLLGKSIFGPVQGPTDATIESNIRQMVSPISNGGVLQCHSIGEFVYERRKNGSNIVGIALFLLIDYVHRGNEVLAISLF